MKKPELVAPAGNMEKLQAALDFGADAVYLGGKEFSLRALAGNFTLEEMRKAVALVHKAGRRVYVTVNIFAHHRDLEELPGYLQELNDMPVDGLIVSDPGVMMLARQYCPEIPLTISTQANVTNSLAAQFYKDMGARRIVAARELSLEELAEIKRRVDIELEVFVHGAMCLSYSGRCWMSLAMTGRDANRGECAHPCRYRYFLREEKRPGHYFPVEADDRGTYVMNSRDLCLLAKVPQLIELGIDAFKIEGRMKSAHYVASVVRIYRQAIDAVVEGREYRTAEWLEELQRVATRPFTEGFAGSALEPMQDPEMTEIKGRVRFCGVVLAYDPEKHLILVEQRAPFKPGDLLEFMEPGSPLYRQRVEVLLNQELEEVDAARHPRELLWMPVERSWRPGTLVGKVDEDGRQE